MAIKQLLIQDKKIMYVLHKTAHGFDVVATDAAGNKLSMQVTHVRRDGNILMFDCNGKPYCATLTRAASAYHVLFAHLINAIPVQPAQKTSEAQPISFEGATATKLEAQTSNTLKSPLAGRIIKLFAHPGQHVKVGQPLVLIESMKMENEICASSAGFIKTIFIAEGNVVQQKQTLIEFEKEGAGDATSKNAHEQEAV